MTVVKNLNFENVEKEKPSYRVFHTYNDEDLRDREVMYPTYIEALTGVVIKERVGNELISQITIPKEMFDTCIKIFSDIKEIEFKYLKIKNKILNG